MGEHIVINAKTYAQLRAKALAKIATKKANAKRVVECLESTTTPFNIERELRIAG